ncbi:molybdopterin-dependent oxidoreductase [Vogesella indigofera]|uniref:molybdopterin-dependent oxidoreductase n=1 Tax=Vogesella indigofera TaxID=45465 RepID=UPI00234E5124|nr:molybdopterin-dependent oxidoreductase [Vogesella indigofera]MDC7712340.1 molybdopterin-dependent oxidoreductase [Vogesella indigofera]
MLKFARTLLAGSLVVVFSANAFALDKPTGRPILTVSGLISEKNAGNDAQFDTAMLDKLPQQKMTVETPWYKTAQTFEGPLFRDVLKATGIKGKKLYVVALNDYAAEIPLADLEKYDVILARKINGKVLHVRDKGPLFIMYPFDKKPELRTKDIYSRCVWQVNRIRVE